MLANLFFAEVHPKRKSDEPGASTTLGALLYADRADTIAESDWVRLVSAIAAGDQDALRDLYERTNRVVFTLAQRICGRREIAEEVTVDVFHDVWRRAAEYDEAGGPVIGWLLMQTRSRAIDRVRFEQRKKRVDPDPQRREEDVDPAGPGDGLRDEERNTTLRAALSTLSADERKAIETAFFSELTYAETAEKLDEPVGTVKTRVRSALGKLRKALDSGGGDR